MKDFLKFTLASIVGMVVVGIFLMIVFFGIIGAMISAGDQTVQIKNNSVLQLTLDAQIIERSLNNPFEELDLPGFAGSKRIGLNDILSCIKKAKTDDNIKGIFLNPSNIQAGMATIEEIRNAIVDFKESGKFVYAYGEFVAQNAYYLISAADKVVLNPQGMIDFRGLGGERNFYKKGADKLGVEFQLVRHGKFKSFGETFTRENMSKENKEQTLAYLKGIWNEMLIDISAERELSIEQLNDVADMVATFRKGDFALEKKLVDELKYFDEVIDELKDLSGIDRNNKLYVYNVAKYKNAPATTKGHGYTRDKIALVYASGDIDGFDEEGIKSDKLSKAIRETRKDSAVKAIVLRINSPGGSAYGSEVIWREVQLATEVKPVIASLGDVAASGGYYIAAAADTIMANRTTITGSIGIFSIIPNLGELFNDKLGITQDVVKTNEHSDLPSVTRKLNKFERDLMQQSIEDGYDVFITRVADGRGMTKEEIDNIGQGRVWSAYDAKEIGLVDLFGDVRDAVQLAKQMAGIEEYRLVAYPELKDPIEELMKQLTGSAKMKLMQNELGESYRYYKQLKNISGYKGLQARMPYDIAIN